MNVNNNLVLREWTPLSALLQNIPTKAQRGLYVLDLNLTCVDFVSEFITLGTNVGIVYWYDREKQTLQRLRFENSSTNVTCIKVVSSVEYMLAAGNAEGTITIFQIPKPIDDLGLSKELKVPKREVERFTVTGIHHTAVTSLEWSMNGMKLFSGDQNGLICKTEIDFNLHLSKSVELLNESYPVVQLCYFNQRLLISTEFRTVLYHTEKEGNHVIQIGNKDRKSLGEYGGCLIRKDGDNQSLSIYTSRQGLRLWEADEAGIVQRTLMFKDVISTAHHHIPLLNPPPPKLSFAKSNQAEISFGRLFPYGDNHLLTYCNNALFVIDSNHVSVLASCRELRRVIDVAIGVEEILVLEGGRSLLRLATKPDDREQRKAFVNLLSEFKPTTASFKQFANKVTNKPFSKFGNKVASLIDNLDIDSLHLGSVKDALPKKKTVVLKAKEVTEDQLSPTSSEEPSQAEEVNSDYKFSPSSPEVSVAEEAQSPSQESSQDTLANKSDVYPPILNDKWGHIGEQDFEDILYNKPKKSKKNNLKDVPGDNVLTTSQEAETAGQLASGEDSIKLNGNVNKKDETDNEEDSGVETASQPGEQNESREELLTQLLRLDQFLPGPPTGERQQQQNVTSAADSSYERTEIPEETTDMIANIDIGNDIPSNDVEESCDTKLEDTVEDKEERQDNVRMSNEGSEDTLPWHNETENECSNNLSLPLYRTSTNCLGSMCYGPPSGSSSFPEESSSIDQMESIPEGYGMFEEKNLCYEETDTQLKADSWHLCPFPGKLSMFSVCDTYVCCVDVQGQVYSSGFEGPGLRWVPVDYQAKQVSLSLSGRIVWKIHKGIAYTLSAPLTRGPFGKLWHRIADHVSSISADERVVWFVKTNGVVCAYKHVDVSPGQPAEVSCMYPIAQVSSRRGVVWGLSTTGQIVYRANVSVDSPLGDNWCDCPASRPLPLATTICLGPRGTAWIVDQSGNIYFITDVDSRRPLGKDGKLWQVLLSEYVFQSIPNQSTPWSKLRLPKMEQLIGSLNKRKLPLVVAGRNSIWVGITESNTAYVSKSIVAGHHWEVFYPDGVAASYRWALVSAGALQTGGPPFGCLWVLGPTGAEIFACDVDTLQLHQISLPTREGVQCISTTPESVWLLTGAGRVLIRDGLGPGSSLGLNWQELNLLQLYQVRLTYVSCGCGVVWGCDSQGVVYLRLGSLRPPSINDVTPAWMSVDGSPSVQGCIFTKVYVGTRGFMVWALDNGRRVYVRQGIYPDLPIGSSWNLVTGIEAVQLTISEQAIWALTPCGEIYRRYGISEQNCMGDYWKRIPGSASVLSASVLDDVWAIDAEGKLVHHLTKSVDIGGPNANSPQGSVAGVSEEGWEILD